MVYVFLSGSTPKLLDKGSTKALGISYGFVLYLDEQFTRIGEWDENRIGRFCRLRDVNRF